MDEELVVVRIEAEIHPDNAMPRGFQNVIAERTVIFRPKHTRGRDTENLVGQNVVCSQIAGTVVVIRPIDCIERRVSPMHYIDATILKCSAGSPGAAGFRVL